MWTVRFRAYDLMPGAKTDILIRKEPSAFLTIGDARIEYRPVSRCGPSSVKIAALTHNRQSLAES